jgi:hypothetical protein
MASTTTRHARPETVQELTVDVLTKGSRHGLLSTEL